MAQQQPGVHPGSRQSQPRLRPREVHPDTQPVRRCVPGVLEGRLLPRDGRAHPQVPGVGVPARGGSGVRRIRCVLVSVYMYMYVYVLVSVYMCIYVYVLVSVYICVCMSKCLYVYICVCTSKCLYVYIVYVIVSDICICVYRMCTSKCLYVYIYVCTSKCLYVYVFMYVY